MKNTVNIKNATSEFGGAAIEYVIVSTFAAILALVGIGFAGKVFYDQMSKAASELGIDPPKMPEIPFIGGS